MAQIKGFKSDITGEFIPDGERVLGKVTFIYPTGLRREARFDLAGGEEEQVDLKALSFVDAKAPGPAKGTPRKKKSPAGRR